MINYTQEKQMQVLLWSLYIFMINQIEEIIKDKYYSVVVQKMNEVNISLTNNSTNICIYWAYSWNSYLIFLLLKRIDSLVDILRQVDLIIIHMF